MEAQSAAPPAPATHTPVLRRPPLYGEGLNTQRAHGTRPEAFAHRRSPASGWSIYGAQRAQPVATHGNRFAAHGKEDVCHRLPTAAHTLDRSRRPDEPG